MRIRSREKDILYVALKEALAEPGCPICWLLLKRKNNWIENLLYELTSDALVREKIREKGFCAHHLWDILRYVDDNPGVDGLSTSIILHDLLSSRMKSILETGELRRREGCMLCGFLEESEEIYLDSSAKWIEDPEMLSLFRGSDSVFCIPHLTAVLKMVSSETASEILRIQLEKMKRVDDELKSLIRKYDYRVKEEVTAEEADARRVAAEILKGRDL